MGAQNFRAAFLLLAPNAFCSRSLASHANWYRIGTAVFQPELNAYNTAYHIYATERAYES